MPYSVDDVIQVKVLTRLGNQAGLNILHYRVRAMAGTGPTEMAVAERFAVLISPVILPLLTQTAAFQGINVKTVFQTPTVGATTADGAGFGTGGASPLPGQVTGILTKQTLFAGRGNRGRVYVPFPSEEDNTAANLPSIGYQAALANYADNLNNVITIGTAPNTITVEPIVFRRLDPATSKVVENLRVNIAWATQRSRGNYGRPNF